MKICELFCFEIWNGFWADIYIYFCSSFTIMLSRSLKNIYAYDCRILNCDDEDVKTSFKIIGFLTWKTVFRINCAQRGVLVIAEACIPVSLDLITRCNDLSNEVDLVESIMKDFGRFQLHYVSVHLGEEFSSWNCGGTLYSGRLKLFSFLKIGTTNNHRTGLSIISH